GRRQTDRRSPSGASGGDPANRRHALDRRLPPAGCRQPPRTVLERDGMIPSPTLAPEFLEALRTRLHEVNSEFIRRYPGESRRRQPVHTVYGGAQVFKSDTAPKMGVLARRSLEDFGPTPDEF